MHRLTTVLSLLTILLLTTAASAQPTFQWGQRWGGAFNDVQMREEIQDMEVDHEGNIYIACSVTPGFMIGDSMHQNHGNSDMMLISFDCEGNVRWYHVFGKSGNDVTSFFKTNIQVDSNGVYYTGAIDAAGSPYHFMDSSFTYIEYRMFMSKFDRDGNLKDFRWIWPGGMLKSYPTQMYKRNDTIWVTFISEAGQIQGHTVPLGYHMGVFDTNFNLHFVFNYGNPTADQRLTGLQVDQAGNIYLGGYAVGGPIEIGGVQWDDGLFLAKFSPQGQLDWVKGQDGAGWSRLFDMELIGDFIYFSGSFQPNVQLFGDSVKSGGSGGAQPLGAKVDKDGNLIYYVSTQTATNSADSKAMVVINDTIYLSSDTYGTHDYGYTSIVSPGRRTVYVVSYDPFTQSGSNISIPVSMGSQTNQILAMAKDANQNIYIGGYFSSSLYINQDTLNKDGGGNYDLFLVKYGVPACVDTTHTGIHLISENRSSVKIAPHPVREWARIEVTLPAGSTGQGLQWEMFDLQGKQVPAADLHWQIQDGHASGTLSREGLPPGLYMWRITGGAGPVASGKILFE